MLLDSLLSLAGSAAVTACIAFFLAERMSLGEDTDSGGGQVGQQYGACTIFLLGLHSPASTGLAFTALVAIFRYIFIVRQCPAGEQSLGVNYYAVRIYAVACSTQHGRV